MKVDRCVSWGSTENGGFPIAICILDHPSNHPTILIHTLTNDRYLDQQVFVPAKMGGNLFFYV